MTNPTKEQLEEMARVGFRDNGIWDGDCDDCPLEGEPWCESNGIENMSCIGYFKFAMQGFPDYSPSPLQIANDTNRELTEENKRLRERLAKCEDACHRLAVKNRRLEEGMRTLAECSDLGGEVELDPNRPYKYGEVIMVSRNGFGPIVRSYNSTNNRGEVAVNGDVEFYSRHRRPTADEWRRLRGEGE
jgi:hypothetical protein